MITCPTCGAQNDPGNRFCDQCGTRLDAEAAVAPAAVSPDQPTIAAPLCPSCGATVLPGEAFCDNCGADLSALAVPVPAPALAADAPTLLAAPTAIGPGQCPACGASVLPGERFCDNCGADLEAAGVPAVTATSADAATLAESPAPAGEPAPNSVSPDAATVLASTPPSAEAPAAPVAEAPAAPVGEVPSQPVIEAAAPPPSEAPPLPEAEAATPSAVEVPAVPVAAPAPGAATTEAPVDAGQGAYAARRAELEAAIARQQQIIAQFEQMQATFGAATPAAVTTGLAEARDALARAEAGLAALGVALATPEPAASAPVAAAAPVVAEAPAPVAPVPAPAAPAPVDQEATAPAGPRLVVVEGGQELPLAGKTEYIVGREDPVSSIFPEVDLTSFGGEIGGVSRQHAKITTDGSQWLLTDLNSTNYTRVDGTRIEPNTPTPIHDGARLQFGRVVLTFHL